MGDPRGMENNPSFLIHVFHEVFINGSELEEISDFWMVVILMGEILLKD